MMGAMVDAPFAPQVLGHLLIRAAERSREAFASAVDSRGLTPTQARTLFALEQPRAMRDLATEMSCDASNITGIADRLARQGLVERVTGEDRRVKLLTLTAEGRKLRRQLQRTVTRSTFPVDTLTEQEQRELERLLRKLLGE